MPNCYWRFAVMMSLFNKINRTNLSPRSEPSELDFLVMKRVDCRKKIPDALVSLKLSVHAATTFLTSTGASHYSHSLESHLSGWVCWVLLGLNFVPSAFIPEPKMGHHQPLLLNQSLFSQTTSLSPRPTDVNAYRALLYSPSPP